MLQEGLSQLDSLHPHRKEGAEPLNSFIHYQVTFIEQHFLTTN